MSSQPNAATLNISLPQPLKRYVDDKVSSGIYGSASEFVREAIREKLQREHARTELAVKLIEGLESGEPIAVTAAHFAKKKKALAKRIIGKSRRS
jgi:antitoxin ParD1/3/4